MLKYSNKIQKVVFLIYFRPFLKSVRCELILNKVQGPLDCCKQVVQSLLKLLQKQPYFAFVL